MRLALLAAAALLVSACSLSDPSGPTVTITAVTIEAIPDTAAGGAAWDPASAPDVYLELQDALGRIYLSTTVVDAESLPAASATEPTRIENLERDYFIFAVEQDDTPSRQWEWMGASPSFRFADAADAQSPTLRVTDATGTFCVELSLRWD